MGFADEILLLAAVACIYLLTSWNSRINILLFFYVLYAAATSFISPFDPFVGYSVIQSLIHIKAFIVVYAFVLLFSLGAIPVKFIRASFFVFSFVFFIALFLNFLFGEAWNQALFDEGAQFRYGFVRPVGYFGHYGSNSYYFSLFMVLFLMIHMNRRVFSQRVQVKKLASISIVDFLMAFPLTVRKGLFVLIPYSFHVFSIFSLGKKVFFFVFFVVFASIIALAISGTEIYTDTILNLSRFFSDDHAYVRGLIFFNGVRLFSEFFPFGVGYGLYGTTFSALNVSVYEYIGISPNLIYTESGSLTGVFDSGFASLLAEGGVIGFLFVFSIIRELFRKVGSLTNSSSFIIFKIITIFTVLLSITEPVWQNGLFTSFYSISVLYILCQQSKFKRFE